MQNVKLIIGYRVNELPIKIDMNKHTEKIKNYLEIAYLETDHNCWEDGDDYSPNKDDIKIIANLIKLEEIGIPKKYIHTSMYIPCVDDLPNHYNDIIVGKELMTWKINPEELIKDIEKSRNKVLEVIAPLLNYPLHSLNIYIYGDEND
jgi:hypothetical protein